MIQQLVINGCSYMYEYSLGHGHIDLAKRLQLPFSYSLAVSGSANTRILRTVLKHSHNTIPTLYVIGLTFLSRWELPISEVQTPFEGRWCNPQNQEVSGRWQHGWTARDTESMVDIKLKSELYSIGDRLEDLMYRVVSTINCLKSRGHRVVVYQQADNLHLPFIDLPQFDLFDRPEIIGRFKWRAVPFQHEQGVPGTKYPAGNQHVPSEMVHPRLGEHHVLNEFLTKYIEQHKILQ